MSYHKSLFDEGLTLDKLAQYRRNNSDDGTSAKTSSTYAEMVEEVERASDIVYKTQAKLFQMQEVARIANDKVKRLEERLGNQDRELVRLHGENSLLLDEGQELRDKIKEAEEEIRERDTGRARPQLEQRLRKAVELLKKDLEASKEKHKAAADDAKSQKKRVHDLELSNKSLKGFLAQMEKKDKEAQDTLDTCKKQLRQATEESTNMIEEVAELREELKRTKKIAEEKDQIIRREVTEKVKEKIRLEVRETVTEQVTEKVTRQVKAETKAEREKEISSLREQFKKVFKENAQWKEKLKDAEAKVDKLKTVEDVIPNLKYEISRLLSLLDKVKKDQELAVSQLETHYRKKIQNLKEESAKEKWAHATDIRKQLNKERGREVDEFTDRIESLSRQTAKLLENAEREKEAYANEVKQRVIEEKNYEMASLKEKLAIRTRESNELLLEAAQDKQAYGEQIRQQLEEEQRRDLYKHTYRIETLVTEKENLQKRVVSFEEELAWAWKENEEKADQLKESQSDLKILEDDIFRLKRKNQNLNTLVERYKQDFDEVSADYSKSKKEFKSILEKSEQTSYALKEKLKQAESMLSEIRSNINVEEGGRPTPNILMARTRLFEEEISRLRQENDNLSASVTQLEHDRGQPQEQAELLEENVMLREKVDSLTSLVHTLRRESLEIEMTRLNGERPPNSSDKREEAESDDQDTRIAQIPANADLSPQAANPASFEELQSTNKALQRKVHELNSLLEECKKNANQVSRELSQKTKEYQSALEASQKEIDGLKEQLDDTTNLISRYRFEKAEAANELERARQNLGDILTVASEDDTAQLNLEIQTLENLLDKYKVSNTELFSEDDSLRLEVRKALAASDGETIKSRRGTNNRISPPKADSSTNVGINSSPRAQSTSSDNQSKPNLSASQLQRNSESCEDPSASITLLEKIGNLNYLLDKYRTELSQTSQELERSKSILASEREEASRLQQRVQSLNLLLKSKEEAEASEGSTEELNMVSTEKIARLEQQIQVLNEEIVGRQSEHDLLLTKENEIKEKLGMELSELREKYSEAQRRANQLETDFQNYVEENGEAKVRADRFEGKLQKFLAEDGEAKTKVGHLERELREYVTKHTEAQSRADRVEAELQELTKTENDIKEKLEAELSELRGKYAEAQSRANRIEADFQKYVEENGEAKVRADRFEGKIQKFLAEDGEAKNKVEHLERELREYVAKHTEAQSRADRLESELQKLINEDAESKQNTVRLRNELQEYVAKHTEAQIRADRLDAEVQQLLTEDEKSKNKTTRLEVDIKEYMVKYANAQSQADHFKLELQACLDECKGANKKASTLDIALQDIKSKYIQAKHRVTQLEAEVLQSGTVIGDDDGRATFRLEAEIHKLKTEHNEISIELKHSKRLFKEELMKSEQEIFDLQKKLSEASALHEENQDDYDKTTKELVEAKRHLEVALVTSETHARSKVKELETLLSQTRSEVEALHQKIQDSEHRLHKNSEDVIKSRKDAEKLESLLDVAQRENERTKDDLAHSIELFKEALAAWRDESKTLNEELRTLRQSSTHSKSTHLTTGSDQSRERSKDSSLSQRTTTSSMTSRATSREEGNNRVSVEEFHSNVIDKSTPLKKNVASVEPVSKDLHDGDDGDDSTSSRAQSSLTLVDKWRRETHQLIEEVEAAQIQRRQNETEHSKVNRIGAPTIGVSLDGLSEDGSSASRVSEPIHCDDSILKKQVSWKTAPWDADEPQCSDKVNDKPNFGNSSQPTASPDGMDSRVIQVSGISQIGSVSDDPVYSKGTDSQIDSASVDSDEVLLNEKLESRIDEWNRTLEDFSSSILGEDKNVLNTRQHSRKINQDYVEGSVSARSEGSILRSAADVASATTKKSVSWNDTVEELSFHSEVVSLGGQPSLESSTEQQQGSASFNFQHDFETASENLQVQGVANTLDIIINEGREPSQPDLKTNEDEGERRDEILSPIGEAENTLEDFNYSWSISSHTASNELIGFKAFDIEHHQDSRSVDKTYDDDSTLDWHVQSVGGSTTSTPFETSDSSHQLQLESQRMEVESTTNVPSTSTELPQDSIHQLPVEGSNAKAGGATESTPAPDNAEEDEPDQADGQEQGAKVHTDANLSRQSNSSSSSSHTGRIQVAPAPSSPASESQERGVNVQVDANLSRQPNSSSSSNHSGRVQEAPTSSSPTNESQEHGVSAQVDANLSRQSNSSSSPSDPRRVEEAATNENRDEPPSDADTSSGKTPKLQGSASFSSSSASMTSSSCPSSFSSSFSSSHSSHSNRRKHVDMTGEVTTQTTFLVPVGEIDESTDDSRSEPSNKDSSGLQRSLEKSGRGFWSKRDIRRFMKKKRSSRKKREESKELATKDAQTSEAKDKKDVISSVHEPGAATTSEGGATNTIEQPQIVSVGSSE